MNSNPTKAPTETGSGYNKVTTQTLGIANERVGDLAGYVLRPDEIETAVVKFLMCYGINADDINCVRVGVNKENELAIQAEIRKGAISKDKKARSYSPMDIVDHSDDDNKNSTELPDFYYRAWHNKLYHGKKKNLKVEVITRRKKDKKKEFYRINIDPEIFIAFVYDINFTDRMYRIAAKPKRGISNKELDNYKRKEIDAIKRRQSEYGSLGMAICGMAIITFTDPNTEHYRGYKTPSGEYIRGFHPNQVDDVR